jgi:hypothetical protein
MGFPQKGRTVYQGFAPAQTLDAITEVPEIPDSMTYDSMAKWLLGSPEAWQRPLDTDRIQEIGMFWSSEDNFVVNPTILGLRPDVEVEVKEIPGQAIQTYEIQMSNWYVQECPLGHADDQGRWFDRCMEHECKFHDGEQIDHRPLQIIDGQHRIRGTQSGPAALEKNPSTNLFFAEEGLGFVLLRSDEMDSFDLQAQAKIFTEITTKGEELFPNHKVYLMYRFAQRGFVKGFDEVDMRPGHPDHAAYETCLRIISPDYGSPKVNPWRRKVPPLRGRQGVAKVASLEFLFSKIRPLFRPGRPFHGLQPFDAAKVIVAFGQAIVLGWDRPSPSLQYYWYPPNTEHGNIKDTTGIISSSGGGSNTTWLRVLFDLFDNILQLSGTNQPSRNQIMDTMKPILHCHFDGKGWDQIPGREANENFLAGILKDFLQDSEAGKVAQEMERNGCADLNDYIARPPLLNVPAVLVGGTETDPQSTAVGKQFDLKIPVPLNMLGPLRIFVVQDGVPNEIEVSKPKRGENEVVAIVADAHYERNGHPITITVEVRNPVGESKQQLELGTKA